MHLFSNTTVGKNHYLIPIQDHYLTLYTAIIPKTTATKKSKSFKFLSVSPLIYTFLGYK